jgi:phenylalanyl-tRNA synthetase beta chain
VGYYIKEGDDPAYFPGRAATVYYRPPLPKTSKTGELADELKNTLHINQDRDIVIGTLGVLHPTVLEKFEITYPCSALEFNLEVFLKRS